MDAIVADIRYAFPKNTAPGIYTVKFNVLINEKSEAFIAIFARQSSVPEFDQAVQEAIYRAAPFPGHEGKMIRFAYSVTVP